MAERLWMATDKGGRCYLYSNRPLPGKNGCFIPGAGEFREVNFAVPGNKPPPGECWEYVRTDLVTASQECLAKAAETEIALRAEIDRLKAELAEARKMPECVAKLVGCCDEMKSVVSFGGALWVAIDKHAAAVRRHYAPPRTISIGEWRLTHGETCRVFSDGRQFLARLTGTMYAVQPDGQLDGRGVWLAERIGD